jgi:ATP-dependent RNA helicase DeaD
VDRRSKIEALTRLIDVHDFRYGIIFCSTKIMVDELDEHLHARGYMTDRLHGDITQAQRDRVMEKFRRRGNSSSSSRPTSRRAGSTSTTSRWCSTSTCRTTPRTTRTASAAPAARASRGGLHLRLGAGALQAAEHGRFAKLKMPPRARAVARPGGGGAGNVFFEKLRATLDAKQFKPHDRMIDRLLDQGYASTDICSALIHLLQEPRTGREPGFVTVSINVGRAQLVTPADLVGKIAGVTRLPATIVGAIDIHEEHTQVDVLAEHAELVVAKLAGIRVKNQSLKLAIVPPGAA